MNVSPHIILVLLGMAVCAPGLPLAAENQAENVQTEAYADVDTIAAGQTFHLAMQYDIVPDWHIYWINPGDTGFATTLEVKAPDGFVVGAVQYPGPHRFEAPGGLASFGFEKRATLVVEITAPATLAPGTAVRFDLHSDWLVCKEVCLLGRADRSVTLESIATVQEAQPANAARFAEAASRLPHELKDLKIGSPRWRGSKFSPRFEATFPKDVEFGVFPLLLEGVQAHEPEITKLDDGSSRLVVTFDVNESRMWTTEPRVLAVLRVKNGDEERHYDLVPEFD